MSYSVTDTRIREEYFFRGLPSDFFIAEARIQLLATFGWKRVGVIYSEELSYARVGTVYYIAEVTLVGFCVQRCECTSSCGFVLVHLLIAISQLALSSLCIELEAHVIPFISDCDQGVLAVQAVLSYFAKICMQGYTYDACMLFNHYSTNNIYT